MKLVKLQLRLEYRDHLGPVIHDLRIPLPPWPRRRLPDLRRAIVVKVEMQVIHGGEIGRYLPVFSTSHEGDSIAPLASVYPGPTGRRASLKRVTIAGGLAGTSAAEERSVNNCNWRPQGAADRHKESAVGNCAGIRSTSRAFSTPAHPILFRPASASCTLRAIRIMHQAFGDDRSVAPIAHLHEQAFVAHAGQIAAGNANVGQRFRPDYAQLQERVRPRVL